MRGDFMNYVSRCEEIMDSWQIECPCTNRTQQSSRHALLSDRCLQIPVFNAQRQYPDNLRLLRDDLFRLDSLQAIFKKAGSHLSETTPSLHYKNKLLFGLRILRKPRTERAGK